MDEAMPGGRFSRPVRHGAVVERAASGRNVRALLQHFERVGFARAPRYLGTSDDGTRDLLSHIDGQAARYPLAAPYRSTATLIAVAEAVRAMHDATLGFVPVEPDAWRHREVAVPVRIDC
ncbi:hypothetical protein ACWEQ8_00425 [Streptomyces noursei]